MFIYFIFDNNFNTYIYTNNATGGDEERTETFTA
jgi:hypothetical protein